MPRAVWTILILGGAFESIGAEAGWGVTLTHAQGATEFGDYLSGLAVALVGFLCWAITERPASSER